MLRFRKLRFVSSSMMYMKCRFRLVSMGLRMLGRILCSMMYSVFLLCVCVMVM